MARYPVKRQQYKLDVASLEKHVLKLSQTIKPNIRKYATTHNLPYYRLRRAYLGLPNRCNRIQAPQNYRLTETQDLALER